MQYYINDMQYLQHLQYMSGNSCVAVPPQSLQEVVPDENFTFLLLQHLVRMFQRLMVNYVLLDLIQQIDLDQLPALRASNDRE